MWINQFHSASAILSDEDRLSSHWNWMTMQSRSTKPVSSHFNRKSLISMVKRREIWVWKKKDINFLLNIFQNRMQRMKSHLVERRPNRHGEQNQMYWCSRLQCELWLMFFFLLSAVTYSFVLVQIMIRSRKRWRKAIKCLLYKNLSIQLQKINVNKTIDSNQIYCNFLIFFQQKQTTT